MLTGQISSAIAGLTVIATAIGLGIMVVSDYRKIAVREAPPGISFPDTAYASTDPENNLLSTDGLFGQASRKLARSQKKIPETRLDLTLRGTFTHNEDNKKSALISKRNGKSSRYYLHDEIVAGTKIIDIAAGAVTLRRNGKEEILKLPILSDEIDRVSTNLVNPVNPVNNLARGRRGKPLPASAEDDLQSENQRRIKLQERLAEPPLDEDNEDDEGDED